MVTEPRDHEERGHSARYLVLIFLVCVATCGVFFSLGFLVGYNERASHVAPSSEIVTGAPAVPPTVNPPPESAQTSPQETGAHLPAPPEPETVVMPGSAGTNPGAPAGTHTETPPLEKPSETAAAGPTKPGSNAPSAPVTSAGEVGEGITLQVVALRNKEDAEALVNILKGQSFPVFLVTPEYSRATDNLFRVQVGPFRTREDAEKVRAKLASEGFKPFIRH